MESRRCRRLAGRGVYRRDTDVLTCSKVGAHIRATAVATSRRQAHRGAETARWARSRAAEALCATRDGRGCGANAGRRVGVRRSPETAKDSESTDNTGTPGEAIRPRTPTVPKEASLRPPGPRSGPQKSLRQAARTGAAAKGERSTAPTHVARPPAAAREQAPIPARGTRDPTALIDWSLGQPSVKE